ncbi:MAG: class I SAM-dependent methyltransferase [Paracoccaceae bacterium]
MSDDATDDGYVLARTAEEYARLRAQAATWSPMTDQVLVKAGLEEGMSVLDAGCGPGEVMRLMAKRVGPKGSVTGVDIDADVGAFGLAQIQKEEAGDFHFHAANLLSGAAVPGAPFDMVFCRFLLIHMDDPVKMVRRLAALTKPGGTLVAMDYVIDALRIAPFHPVLARGIEIVNSTLAGAGRPLDAGVRLGEWFRDAGLPMPHGTDVQGFLEVSHADSMLAKSVAGFGAGAVKMGLASEEEIARLPDEIRAVAAKAEHLVHWPTVTAAWTRVGG